jgi:hypothetical protein
MNYEVQVNISFLHVLVVIEKADPYFAYAKLSTPNNEPHQHRWMEVQDIKMKKNRRK